jgi:thiol-disulfide isomerase/thioredoxin
MFKNLLAAGIILLALLPGCTSQEKKTVSPAAAPDFTLQDLSGKKVSLSGLKGSVVLVEFWATWCPPCRTSVPGLERLHKAYGGKGLTILAVSVDEGGWDKVRDFVSAHKVTYSVLQGTEDVSTRYLVRMIPAMYLIDKQGVIRKQFLGGGNEEELEKEIQALL